MQFRSVLLALGLLAARQDDPAPTPLQLALGDLDPAGNWHYNDLAAGIADARANGKPLLVVIRCAV